MEILSGRDQYSRSTSRGCSAEELVRNHSWWKGSEFLNHSPEYWPQEPQQSYIDNEEKALAEIKKTSPTIVYSMANPSINNDLKVSISAI
jgi:hypothetical protein